MTRLYSYVVLHDIGFAPNPFHGWCTLATCKPGIRRTATVGDWIMGTGSSTNNLQGHLVYAMRVSEVLTFDEYWLDPRFSAKRPSLRGSLKQAFGDNIYHRNVQGVWSQENSRHSLSDGSPNPGHIEVDTSVNAVLASQEFTYFGGKGPRIPDHLRSPAGLDVVHTGRGHRCRFPPATVDAVSTWILSLDMCIQGKPNDW